MRNFTRNSWRLWRRPAALLWSDESTTKTDIHTSHLSLHLHTTILTFYIYTQNIKYTTRVYRAAKHHKNTHNSVLPPLHHRTVGVKGGSTAERQKLNNKKKRTKSILKFFRCFEEAFLSFSFNKLWCHSSECRPPQQLWLRSRLESLVSIKANHTRAYEQRR